MTGDRGLRLFKAAVDIARTRNLLRAWRPVGPWMS